MLIGRLWEFLFLSKLDIAVGMAWKIDVFDSIERSNVRQMVIERRDNGNQAPDLTATLFGPDTTDRQPYHFT